jgi:hypothetical protein
MRHFFQHATMQPGRRSFLLGTAGALAAGLTTALCRPGLSKADGGASTLPPHVLAPLPAPKPIPGGTEFPPFPLIHELFPGPETITLPFTLVTLQGLNVEPSTITDFVGVTALAYHVGTVTGSDGLTYNLETDVRVFQGQYVGEDGAPHEGTFGEM